MATIVSDPRQWTIEIGTHLSVEALVADIEKGGVIKIGKWARGIISQVTVSAGRRNLKLVARSVAELGFTEVTSLQEIYARAIEAHGLELVPSEAALQLRRQYGDQPKGEELMVAMEALLEGPDHHPSVFVVTHDEEDGILLEADGGHEMCRYSADTVLIFVVPPSYAELGS